MSKLTGPLFSLTARGTIADAITYSGWRGVQYVRTRVVPANPQTANQTEVRNIFHTLCDLWSRSPAIFREPWTANAQGQPYTDRNKLIALNIPALQGDVNMNDYVGSPGQGGAIPPASITVTPGAGQLTVDVTAPTLPPGWTITAAQVCAFIDGDASTPLVLTPVADEDTSSPYSVVLTGLTTVLHQVRAWLKWAAPDGSTKYSTALADTGTPT